jgi:small ligand-binding sensory domain FIST
LPGVDLHAFHLDQKRLPTLAAEPAAWRQLIGLSDETQPDFLLLPDPFSFPIDTVLHDLDRQFPTSRKVGGLASGGSEAGSNVLYLGDRIHRSGVVGLALAGNIETDTLVAQGCRPIGEPLFVTGAQRNVLRSLDGQPPLAIINELYASLDSRDQELLRHSLFVGIAMQDARQEYRQGDFLIRNIIGLDQESGAVAIGAVPQENSIVQFHLRDARTSAEDLEALLSRFDHLPSSARPQGSLLFSCLGRGNALYGRPDHDTHAFLRHVGDVPLGGFFCNGEIGPVQGTTFLHGYTSAFALFKPRAVR